MGRKEFPILSGNPVTTLIVPEGRSLRKHHDRADEGERTGFRRLEDHAIACQQGGHDLREGKSDRRIPGDDRYHHAIGTIENECPSVRCRETAPGVQLGRIGSAMR